MATVDQNSIAPTSGVPQSKQKISLLMLAMMNTAVVVGLEGLPEVGGFGLSLIFYYAVFTVIYFLPVELVAAELGVGWPGEGGVYSWVKEALGERWAFLAIWCQWLQILVWYPTVLAVCAVSASYMFDPSFGEKAWFVLIVSLAIFWFATIINFKGIHESGRMTSFLLIVGTLLPVLAAIGLAAWWLLDGRESAIPLEASAIIPDISSVGQVVGVLAIFSFLSGLEVNSVHFRNTENPQRNIPRSLLISGVLVLGVSILGALSVAVLVPVGSINLASGTLQVFEKVFGVLGVPWLLPVIAGCALLGMVGHIMIWVIGPTESLRVAAKDGLIPAVFQKMTKGGAPKNVMLLQAAIVSIICMLGMLINLNDVFYVLTVISAQIYLVMYALMFVSVIVLRFTKPDIDRPFRIPGGTPGLWIVAGTGLIASVLGICFMFVPPDMQDVTISATMFTPIILISFAAIIGIPFVLYKRM
ncbi:MAG: amino acid permease [Phycisphaerae bacterium]|nr:amino acid permease [Phycisphaerae bacterium]